jgi:hypothetical protein
VTNVDLRICGVRDRVEKHARFADPERMARLILDRTRSRPIPSVHLSDERRQLILLG